MYCLCKMCSHAGNCGRIVVVVVGWAGWEVGGMGKVRVLMIVGFGECQSRNVDI